MNMDSYYPTSGDLVILTDASEAICCSKFEGTMREHCDSFVGKLGMAQDISPLGAIAQAFGIDENGAPFVAVFFGPVRKFRSEFSPPPEGELPCTTLYVPASALELNVAVPA